MVIKIYVNADEERAVSEKDFETILDKIVEERSNETDRFNEWLYENFTYVEIFNFTSGRKEREMDNWRKECRRYILDYLDEWGWAEYELEI